MELDLGVLSIVAPMGFYAWAFSACLFDWLNRLGNSSSFRNV